MRGGATDYCRERNRQASIVVACAAMLGLYLADPRPGMVAAEDSPSVLVPREAWSTYFASAPVALTYDAAVAANGLTAQWTLAVDRKTIGSGAAQVEAEGAGSKVSLRFDAPEVRDGLPLEAVLAITLRGANRRDPIETRQRTLWFFGEEAFVDRQQWLEEREVTLFDPRGGTAEMLAGLSIPFVATKNVEQLANLAKGMIVVGEGVSAREYRGLPIALQKAAAAGRPVLWLAPTGGTFAIPGAATADLPRPARVMLAGTEIIAELDKRLDAQAWPADGGLVASSLLIRGEGRTALVEAVANDQGWPWLEVTYPTMPGRLIVAGFGLNDHWEAGPTPRYLLARMLDRLWGISHEPTPTDRRIDQ
jgi:hypothetical protein